MSNGNILGEVLQVVGAGESHGPEMTTIVLGTPAGVDITQDAIQADLTRRRPGQSEFTTPRDEEDLGRITAGVFRGVSTGAPVCVIVPNTNTRGQDYESISGKFRPGHADVTMEMKYGFRDEGGGGRASFRTMISAVVGGSIAKLIVPQARFTTYVDQIGDIKAVVDGVPSLEEIERSPVRCPDPAASERMMELILDVKEQQDSIGGIIKFIIEDAGPNLGEPIFGKLNARMAAAMTAINATTAVEFGDGFGAALLRGSQYNDAILAGYEHEGILTATNHQGGTQGGITNGMPITGRVGFPPTSSIGAIQQTIDRAGDPTTIQIEGRHDPCVLPRAVPAVEGMAALVIADLTLLNRLSRI